MRENPRSDIVSGTTHQPERFEMGEGHALFRPEGHVSFREAIDLASRAIVYCRENGIRRLLIDATNLTGFRLGTPELFKGGEQVARDAMAAVKVAFVMRPEHLDPERFGITVARNRGMFANAFPTEAEALKWLLDPKAE